MKRSDQCCIQTRKAWRLTVALRKKGECIKRKTLPTPNVLLTGDFNFPQINWSSETVKGAGRSSEETRGTKLLCDLMDEQCLSQIVEQPTRGENILNLVSVNNCDLVYNYEVRDVGLSAHKMILLSLVWPVASSKEMPEKESILTTQFSVSEHWV